MKSVFLFILFFAFYAVNSQSLSDPTIREIYDFQPGDTMEYEISSKSGYTQCVQYDYSLYIYTGRHDSADVLSYGGVDHFHRGIHCNYWPGYHDTIYTYPFFSSYSALDSDLFFHHITTRGCDTTGYICHYDGVSTDPNKYNGRVICSHRKVRNFAIKDSSFAIGLGLVHYGFGNGEDDTAPWQSVDLIYYHKVGGEVWGHPVYLDLLTGVIPELSLLKVDVIPNPVSNRFSVRLTEMPQEGLQFELYDMTGRIINLTAIRDKETNFESKDFVRGLYLWKITSNGRDIDHGKLLID